MNQYLTDGPQLSIVICNIYIKGVAARGQRVCVCIYIYRCGERYALL